MRSSQQRFPNQPPPRTSSTSNYSSSYSGNYEEGAGGLGSEANSSIISIPTTPGDSRPTSPFLPPVYEDQDELPLHHQRRLTGPGYGGKMSGLEVVDSTSARRRGVLSSSTSDAMAAVGGGHPDLYGPRSDGVESSSDGLGEKGKVLGRVGIGGDVAGAGGFPAYAELKARGGRGVGGGKGGVSEKWARMIPEKREPQSWASIWREAKPFLPLVIYTLLSFWTRLYKIGANNTVVWDEAHFGKFGAYYLNQSFYFDVHPPLGKMLVGLAGVLSGFNGSFDFPSGTTYPDHVPFRSMRVLMALPGIAMVPLAWGTAVELGLTGRGRHIVTLMVLCDLAWLVISRFVLLDSMLLFFTFCTIYCLACFHNEQSRPFTIDWYLWLTFTGVSIGCVTSVKWVGLFATAVVGLYTVEDLWNKFGDLTMPIRVYARHWLARILCLIILPFSIYMLCFKIHFLILNRSGPGDAQMSSLFQAHLRGNDFWRNPLEPAYGSKLTLKNMGYGGGLLHSHVQTYPVGSQQQQVTCYHYKDSNNDWIITPTWEDPAVDPNGDIRYLSDKSVVRLVHAATGRNLHSHPIVAPVSKLNWEVSSYGNDTIGDSNDYWIIEVVDDMVRGRKDKFERIHSLTTRMRFRHQNLGCYLRAANQVLPQWGFKQVEVSCDKANNPRDEHTYWNVESHWNDRLPEGNQKLYRSPFFRDFWHLNVAMATSNNALVPDADKEDSIASGAFDWPFLYSGMRMNGWADFQLKFYLVGNPIVWWGGSLSLLVFLGSMAWYLMRFQRKYNDFTPGQWNHFLYVTKLAFSGWLLHYLPFLIMGRVTYLHHYLPTLWFSVIMFGFMLDHFVFTERRLTERAKTIVFASVVVLIVGTFLHFRDCAFGIDGPVNARWFWRWRKSWNIYNT